MLLNIIYTLDNVLNLECSKSRDWCPEDSKKLQILILKMDQTDLKVSWSNAVLHWVLGHHCLALKINFFFLFCFYACVYMYHLPACGGQREASDPLKGVVSLHVDAGIELPGLLQEQQMLLTMKPSL